MVLRSGARMGFIHSFTCETHRERLPSDTGGLTAQQREDVNQVSSPGPKELAAQWQRGAWEEADMRKSPKGYMKG